MTDKMWLAVGFIAQGIFIPRWIVQWLVSERRRQSTIPRVFWYFSIVGSFMLLSYAIHRLDPVFILGQGAAVLLYTRNLMLFYSADSGEWRRRRHHGACSAHNFPPVSSRYNRH